MKVKVLCKVLGVDKETAEDMLENGDFVVCSKKEVMDYAVQCYWDYELYNEVGYEEDPEIIEYIKEVGFDEVVLPYQSWTYRNYYIFQLVG